MIIQRVLDLLDENSLKAVDLCRHLGISTSTMTNWKNRGTDPPAKLIIPICEFLGVSCEYLLTGSERSERGNIDVLDKEWLHLIHQLPKDAQLEFKGEIKGYLKCLDNFIAPEEPLKNAK